MKEYTYQEIQENIEKLKKEIESIDKKLEELRLRRKTLGMLEYKEKKQIDEDILTQTELKTCLAKANLMFLMYEDSISVTPSGLTEEDVSRLEAETENGDGLSKLMVFCQKCFVDKNILDSDIASLEREAEDGDRSSDHILWCYNSFFKG